MGAGRGRAALGVPGRPQTGAHAEASHQRAVTAPNVDGTAYWPNVRLIIGLAP